MCRWVFLSDQYGWRLDGCLNDGPECGVAVPEMRVEGEAPGKVS